MGVFDWLRGRATAPAQASPAPAAPAAPPPPPSGVLPKPGAPLLALSRMTPGDRRRALLVEVINPTLALLAARGIPSDDRTRVMLLAIAGQESDCAARVQGGAGPARGLWQFERGGGVAGVLSHRASMAHAAAIAQMRGFAASASTVHPALATDDVLACAFARLLLWTDSRPMPAGQDDGWRVYVTVWRPGAYMKPPYTPTSPPPPSPRWAENWRLAQAALVR